MKAKQFARYVEKQYLVGGKKGRRPRLSHAKLRTSLLGYQLLATYDRLSLVPRPPPFFVLGQQMSHKTYIDLVQMHVQVVCGSGTTV